MFKVQSVLYDQKLSHWNCPGTLISGKWYEIGLLFYFILLIITVSILCDSGCSCLFYLTALLSDTCIILVRLL